MRQFVKQFNLFLEKQGEDNPELKYTPEYTILQNAERFLSMSARDVIVPRTQMVTLEKNKLVSDIIPILNDTNYTKIPIYEEKIDNIIGILEIKKLMQSFPQALTQPVYQFIKEAFFVSFSHPVIDLFFSFLQSETNIAIVVDEHGGVDGMITMQDLVAVFAGRKGHNGDFQDNAWYEVQPTGLYMDAQYSLEHFNKLYNLNLSEEGVETIGGYISHILGYIPKPAKELTIEGVNIVIKKANDRSIEYILAPKV